MLLRQTCPAAVEQKPRRGCGGCLYCCLTRVGIAILILAVPFWYFCLYAPPLRISKETTYVLGPLTADGKQVDYFRAFEEITYPAEMKTDDNGYRVLVRGAGVGDAYNEKEFPWQRPQIYEKLGLDPNVAPTLSLISPDTFFTRQLKELDESSDAHKELAARRDAYWHQNNPWLKCSNHENIPVPPEWLEQNTAGIDLLGEAVRKPFFCMPYLRKNESEWSPLALVSFSDFQRLREFARACTGRAIYRIGTGDIDGAIDDIITIYRLGRHAGRHPMLVSWLVGIAIEGVAASIDIAGNPASPPSREQWERFRSELAALPPRITCAEALESERLFGLGCLQSQMNGQPIVNSLPLLTRLLLSRVMVDQNVLFKTLNNGYDQMLGAAQGTIDDDTLQKWLLSLLRPSFNPLRWLSMSGRSEQAGQVFLSLLLPATQAAREAERRATCTINLKQLTIALMLYEKDHGAMPDGDWREAIRPYLGENSDQYFRCPTHPNLAADETAYAMIRREDGATSLSAPNSLLLVELRAPMKLSGNDGTITEAAARATDPDPYRKPDATDGLSSYHAGGYNTSLRGGGVQFFPQTMSKEKLAEAISGEEVP
ncbi:MAG: DUF1559 domain-containing protein [Thermoguttaceae bacterium]